VTSDRAAGRQPFLVAAAAGTTNTGAVDPLPAIADVARQERVWLHVDAAFAGSAAVCPELRAMHDGLELADSYAFNPHKWMFVNFDCDCFYVADRSALVSALSVLPEYLRNPSTESGRVIDYRDWQIPLGRRFRSLKLWFVIRHYGADGLRQQIRGHVDLAHELASWISDDPTFELAAPVPLNLVCFRHLGGDDANRQLMERLNDSGAMFLTHTKLDDKFTLRMSIGQTNTRREHVEKAWAMIRSSAS
jgi:aromatic-L-amino-acid decarboxylase